MIRLAAFLGNPGREYARTRHNLAWMAAEELDSAFRLSWQKKFKGEIAQHAAGGAKTYLLKPETFMNRSGESIVAALQFYKLTPDELLVVHDDLELGFGEAGIRKGGGLAGHNGLRSIARALGTPEFHRFRLGIGRPAHGNVSSFVLSRFNPEEEADLPRCLGSAVTLIRECLEDDIRPLEAKYMKTKLL